MKRSTQVLLPILLCLAMNLFQGCLKRDIQADNRTESARRFFQTKGVVKPVVTRVMNNLEKQNKLTGFVAEIAAKYGNPIWDKAIVQKSSNPYANRHKRSTTKGAKNSFANDSTSNLSDTTVYIPLALDNGNEVDAYIKAEIADSTEYLTLYGADEYQKFLPNPYTGLMEKENAEDYAKLFMILGKEVFGTTQYKVTDSRLFKEDFPDSIKSKVIPFVSIIDAPTQKLSDYCVLVVVEGGVFQNGQVLGQNSGVGVFETN